MTEGGEQNISFLRQTELNKKRRWQGPTWSLWSHWLMSHLPSFEGRQKKKQLLILTRVGGPIPRAELEAPGRENGCPYRCVQNQAHDLLPQTWSSAEIHYPSDGGSFPPRASTRSPAVGMDHLPHSPCSANFTLQCFGLAHSRRRPLAEAAWLVPAGPPSQSPCILASLSGPCHT